MPRLVQALVQEPLGPPELLVRHPVPRLVVWRVGLAALAVARVVAAGAT